jgi:serine/threonine-protein kinase
MRRLDQAQATELPRTEGAYAPFFSPDGHWVGFFAGGKLKKVSMTGGAAIVLCNASLGMGGSWGEDGTIIAALAQVGGLFRIPDGGGAPARLTEPREGGEVSQAADPARRQGGAVHCQFNRLQLVRGR